MAPQMPSASPYFLQSERLGFRTWTEADLPLALGLWGDPEVAQLIDARGQLSDDQVRDRLHQEISTEQSHAIQYWPIFRLDDAVHIGCCGLRPYSASETVFEIGFHIVADHWGHGYASEAARAVIGYAFHDLGVEGLFAGHHPQNHASRQVLTKLGFRYTHDAYYEPTGLRHPSYLLTVEDYRVILDR